jgi:phosphohistidine phosphatase SixA
MFIDGFHQPSEGDTSMRGIRLVLLGALVALLPAVAISQPVSAQPEWVGDLRHGGYIIVFRHGATYTDQAKTDPMSNPTTGKAAAGERLLNSEGRAQAKSIGEARHKLAIPVSVVMTSPLQRAVDTGTLLGFGEVTTKPELAEAGSALSAEENKHRADALRQLVSQRPPADKNLVIVTHKPNLIEAFGKDWSGIREGEASVFAPDGTGYKLVLRIRAEEWGELPQATH